MRHDTVPHGNGGTADGPDFPAWFLLMFIAWLCNVYQVVAKKFDETEQRTIDSFMIGLDGTENKKNFGANAIHSSEVFKYFCQQEPLKTA